MARERSLEAAPPDRVSDEIRVRILEGTLEAIGRHGLRKLGMSDAAAVAGVSRGTLYRYFPSKEALLSALFDYERHRFEDQVNRTLADVAPGQARLETHLQLILDYLRNHPALAGLIETEPRYVLGFLEAHFESFRRATSTMLEPVLGEADVLGRDHVTLETLSDLLYRLLLSFFLFPPASTTEASSVLAISAVVAELSGSAPSGQRPSGRAGSSRGAPPASAAKNGA